MRRKTFDLLLAAVGFLLTAVLVVAGVLLMWGYSYSNNSVKTQLAAQNIYFPPKGSSELANPKIAPYLDQYAGQLMTTGAQAEAYANHFIYVHLGEIGNGKTYSQVSAESMANPSNKALAAETTTLFQGTTLRGLLLNAYGWWKIGQIALIAAWFCFGFAVLMLIFSILGLVHWRRVEPTAEI